MWMFWRIAFVPGGQPIGALEKFAGKLGKLVMKLFNRDKKAEAA